MLKFASNIKKPSTIVAIDFGTDTLRLVQMQRRGERFVVNHLARQQLSGEVRENANEALLEEALRQLLEKVRLKHKQRQACLTVNFASTQVRIVDSQATSLEEARRTLRLNAPSYFRQDCSDYYLDCAILPVVPKAQTKSEGKTAPKMNLLVVRTRKTELQPCISAAEKAGLTVLGATVNPVAVINAFESTWGDAFRQQTFAVVDIGLRLSSVNLVARGTPVLTRLVEWGGDNISQYIAQMLSVEWKAAEEEKLQMGDAVRALVRDSLRNLIQQVRSSLDYLEHEYNLSVERLGVAGGSARSPWVVQSLGELLGVQCEPWKQGTNLELEARLARAEEAVKLEPDFASAVGAGISFLS